MTGKSSHADDRNRKRIARESDTGAHPSQGTSTEAERSWIRRANETDSEHEQRFTQMSENARARRANETVSEREERLAQMSQRASIRRENETDAERSTRRAQDAASHAAARASESVEQHRERLNANAQRLLARSRLTRSIAVSDGIDESTIEEHYCGPMNVICGNCGGKNFKDEKPKDGLFTHCCQKGKVKLDPLQPVPDLIKNLMTANDPDSKNFMENIRSYNSALAFASMGAQIKRLPGFSPYCFRIHGQIYHRTSPLHPAIGESPKYALLYILDANEALQQRMSILENAGCIPTLMEELDLLLRDVNKLAEAYKMMREVELEEEEKARAEGRAIHPVMSIRQDRQDDQRRYNAPPRERNCRHFSKCRWRTAFRERHQGSLQGGNQNLTNIDFASPMRPDDLSSPVPICR